MAEQDNQALLAQFRAIIREENANLQSNVTELEEKLAELQQETTAKTPATDRVWKTEGNKKQYSLNKQWLDSLSHAIWGLEHGKIDYGLGIVKDVIGDIERRQKLILMADTSQHGWRTVNNYLGPEIADDEEDQKKIRAAEKAAAKEEEAKKKSYMSRSRLVILNSNFVFWYCAFIIYYL